MPNNSGNSGLPRGADLLHNPRLNKSTAFSEAERAALRLVGLLPEGIDSEELQLQRIQFQWEHSLRKAVLELPDVDFEEGAEQVI